MKMIDFHCDTMLRIFDEEPDTCLFRNNFQVDIEKLKKNNSLGQFFALFIDLEELKERNLNTWEYTMGMHKRFIDEISKNENEISLVRNWNELELAEREGKIGGFLTVEEGGIIENDESRLDTLYDLGIRLITLTWNYENSLGFPNGQKYEGKGLTTFGKSIVEKMNEKGMLVDVSHLSDQGFYDVSQISNKPFIASHSCAREVWNHGRNLTDDMLKTLGEKGGLVGLNFCPKFLNKDSRCTIESLVQHGTHMINKAGIESVGIGTDFDGVTGFMEIENIAQMDKLYDGFKKAGYKESQLEKIWFENGKRIIKEVLK